MADYLFGDLDDATKPGRKTAPGDDYLFGDMFPAAAGAAAPDGMGDLVKAARLLLTGGIGRAAIDKGFRKEAGDLMRQYGLDQLIPAPMTEKPIFGQMAKEIGGAMVLPGQVAQSRFAVQPEVPGQWSDADEARRLISEGQITDRAANLAGIVGGGSIPSVVREGASSLPILNNSMSPEVAQLARTAIDKYGYPVRPGQLSDNWMARSLDSLLQKLPFSGYAKSADAQQRAINRGVANMIGEKADIVNPEIMSRARERMSDSYNSLFDTERAQLDPQFIGTLVDRLEQAGRLLNKKDYRVIQNAVKGVLEKVDTENGTISGRVYQNLRNDKSDLKKLSRQNSNAAPFAREIKNDLDDLFRRSVSPENQGELQRLDKQWAIMKSIRPLVNESGDIAPARLMGIARSGDAGLERVAFGRGGDMAELANIGQQFKTMPSSNTAENSLLLQFLTNPLTLLGGGALGGGMAAAAGALPHMAAVAGSGALATRGLGRYLSNPDRAENMIASALGETARQGNKLADAGIAPYIPLIENMRDNREVTVRPWSGPSPQ